MFTNRLYIGLVRQDDRDYPGKHAAIVEPRSGTRRSLCWSPPRKEPDENVRTAPAGFSLVLFGAASAERRCRSRCAVARASIIVITSALPQAGTEASGSGVR